MADKQKILIVDDDTNINQSDIFIFKRKSALILYALTMVKVPLDSLKAISLISYCLI